MTCEANKKVVSKYIESYITFESDDIKDLIKDLQNFIEGNKEFDRIAIESIYDSSCYDVVGHRLETDSEYQERMERNKVTAESRGAREYEQYLKLKAKFEGE